MTMTSDVPFHPVGKSLQPGFACDLARDEERTLLSSDTGIFEYTVIRDGVQSELFVPLRLTPQEQLGYVLEKFGLPIREPRCMACGGELVDCRRSWWAIVCRRSRLRGRSDSG